MSSNIAGALAYPLGFIRASFILNMWAYRIRSVRRFHAWQSIFLSCCYFVFFMGWSMLTGMLFAARLGFVFTVLAPVVLLLRLACILLGFFLMYKAFKNEHCSLPFIGRMAANRRGRRKHGSPLPERLGLVLARFRPFRNVLGGGSCLYRPACPS